FFFFFLVFFILFIVYFLIFVFYVVGSWVFVYSCCCGLFFVVLCFGTNFTVAGRFGLEVWGGEPFWGGVTGGALTGKRQTQSWFCTP
ncbi:hypothetical protein, partial [Pseudomonas marginalis]|uniref:hypothetical protein n=1 Tax=Pseudomonas marginalis TaxID=298 RepID=UPI0034D5F04D